MDWLRIIKLLRALNKKEPSFVFQQDKSDCGIACLLSIIKYHGGDCTFEDLRRLSGTTSQGTTLLGLKQAAENLGFDAEGLEAANVCDLSEIKNPSILHVKLDSGLQHYLTHWPNPNENSKLTLADPAKGVVVMTLSELDKIWETKALLSLKPNKDFKTLTHKNKERRSWIVNLIRDDFNILLVSLFLGLFIAALNLISALFSQKLIDSILPSGNVTNLVLSLIFVGLLILIRISLSYLRGLLMLSQGVDFNKRIIGWFYGKLLQLPKSFFDTRKTGDIIARMHDTRRIQTVLSLLSGNIALDVLVILVSLAFVATYSWTIALVLMGAVPVFFALARFFNQPIIAAQKSVMSGYALVESHFVDTIQGISDIKLFNRQFFFEDLNSKVYGQFQERAKNLGLINIRFGMAADVIYSIFLLTIFGLASYSVLTKEMQIGGLVAVLGISGAVLPSMTRLVVANIQIQEALVAFDRMFEFTSVASENVDLNNQSTIVELEKLQLQNISFRFPGRKRILTKVLFTLQRGEMVCLFGESGSGKSTLLQLIQKFYIPESGQIFINDKNLTDVNSLQWRDLIGSVPQVPKIFNGTLLYNITLSDDPTASQAAIDFCELNGFNNYFKDLPQGHLSLIGEEGINLSGGQKQLVAIARALYRNPKLILLDEATSSMDKQMETFVLNLIKSKKLERITLLVTHQDSLASQCDKIVRI